VLQILGPRDLSLEIIDVPEISGKATFFSLYDKTVLISRRS